MTLGEGQTTRHFQTAWMERHKESARDLLCLAEREGREHRVRLSATSGETPGQYFTSRDVAQFMARLCSVSGDKVSILDPGAGAGILSIALIQELTSREKRPSAIRLVAYEIDNSLVGTLSRFYTWLKERLREKRTSLEFEILSTDFILANAWRLESSLDFFDSIKDCESLFDVVICNPPYFKLGKEDRRALAASSIVSGQPNIYALFMAIAAASLKEDGEFIFITPRSYAAGPYFHAFRSWFFPRMRPEFIHLFGSRRDPFINDDVLQENIILKARRLDNWGTGRKKKNVIVSFSQTVKGLSHPNRRKGADGNHHCPPRSQPDPAHSNP